MRTNISRKNFFLKSGVFDSNLDPIENFQEYYSVLVAANYYRYRMNEQTGKQEGHVTRNLSYMITCTQEYMKKYFPTLMDNPFDYHYCLEENFNLELWRPADCVGENKWINVYFETCQNSTSSIIFANHKKKST